VFVVVAEALVVAGVNVTVLVTVVSTGNVCVIVDAGRVCVIVVDLVEKTVVVTSSGLQPETKSNNRAAITLKAIPAFLMLTSGI
jgi:ribosomal protein L14E/L6E/L27E